MKHAASLGALRTAVLDSFVARLGDDEREARAWSDARRGVVYRRVCVDVAFTLLATLAAERGMPAPSAWSAAPWSAAAAAARAGAGWAAASVGVAYEGLLDTLPRWDGEAWALGGAHARRAEGAYFTPPELAAHVVGRALALDDIDLPRLGALRVVDPAMGAGAFLVAALRALAARATRLGLDRDAAARLALGCLHGVDKDADVARIGAALLWVEAGVADVPLAEVEARLRPGDALLDPPTGGAADGFDWRAAFPEVFADRGGFDVVVGNPPWGKLKADLKAFVSVLDARARDLQGAGLRRSVDADVNEAWTRFQADVARYARALRSSGAYTHQRGAAERPAGDPDLYRYFLERAAQLAGPRGRVGLIVPAAAYQSEGAAGLRRLYLEGGEVEDLLSFENRDRAFPIHGMFTYAALIWQRGGPRGVRRARFGLRGVAALASAADDDAPAFDVAWLRAVSGEGLIVPEVRTRREQDLYGRVHAAHPQLGDPHPAWNVGFVRELDMTLDAARFLDADDLVRLGATTDGTTWTGPDGARFVPLYEGRLVHQFDHAAKRYLGGAGRKARWEPAPLAEKAVRPHFWVREDDAIRALPARAGFCDITGHANERTALAALIPAGWPAGNKVPTLRFDRPDPRLPLLWLAVANSFVVDWILRRRVATTLNFFHWKLTPFPRLDPDDPRAAALWTRTARLCATPVDPRERARLRAELDVAVAGLYGLDHADLELILADFPALDRRQPALPGEPRSTVTRDLLLLHWARGHAPADVAGLEARVAAAEALGAVAYVPSEHASRSGTGAAPG